VHTIEQEEGAAAPIRLTVTLDGGAWSALRTGLFSRGERTSCTH
jgi:hypothetical protein